MGFAEDLQKICDKTGENLEDAIRMTAFEMLSSVVKMSPVGNPDIWEANKNVTYQRETHNLFVPLINKTRDKGTDKLKKLSKSELSKEYKLKAGQDYVGGRFRANWQIGITTINAGTYREPDKTGQSALTSGSLKLNEWKDGKTIYITNSLPYAQRLEYGWSSQAPGGMVRLTAQRFSNILQTQINSFT